MDTIEPFNEQRNKARVNAGLKGGPFFKNPVEVPARSIVDGYPAEVTEKMQGGKITQGTPIDSWNERRQK
jgi:hypothetical protein